MGAQREDRDLLGGGVGAEHPRGLPAVDLRQAEIEQDEVRPVVAGAPEPLRAVDRGQDLEAVAGETAREHVAVEVVVLDEQDALCRHRGVTGSRQGGPRQS